jgi:hypothetical protein
VRSETSGRDDRVDRTDPERALDGVDAVELGCDSPSLSERAAVLASASATRSRS